MNEFEKRLFSKGYIKLQPGSYRIWVSSKWHEMFKRRRLVAKNFYNQYCPNMNTLEEFIKWLDIYIKVEHDRDFPKSNPWLQEEELRNIRREIV